MRWLRILSLRLKSLFRRDRLDADAREELQQHLDREVEFRIAAGLTPEAARRAAALDVGNMPILVEASRDARGFRWLDALRADVRYAFRQIRRRPGFSAAVILTLAIGAGATSAVFAVVDSVLLRPLPFPESDRLYAIYEINNRPNVGRTRATVLNFIDWQTQAKSFEAMGAHAGTGFTLTGRGEPEFTLGQLVTPNFFDLLRIRPALGRTFQPHEGEAGQHRVVILSHALFTTHFGGDESILNSVTTINGEPYQIVGILPASFSYPRDEYRLFVPFVSRGQLPGAPPVNRSARYLQVVGRLAPTATASVARAELDAIGARLATEYPDTNRTVTIGMAGLAEDIVGDADRNLVIVLVAVGFVLLIACVNVSGLALARGQARGRELGVRAAIGASQARLVRQLATEGFVLFLIGGAAGILLAAWTVDALASTLPESLPRVHEIAIDGRFVLLTSVVIVVTGIVSSVLPALQVTRRTAPLVAGASRGVVTATRAASRSRTVLIVAQIATAVVLLAGAALALRSFARVWAADRGFDIDSTMTFAFVLPESRYPNGSGMKETIGRADDEIRRIPEIEAIGLTTHLPLGDNNLENRFTVDGVAADDGQDPPVAGLRFVAGDYLDAIGGRLLQGRHFAASDTDTSERVAIVTSDFVRRHIPNREAVGTRLKAGGPGSDTPWHTIVGVIADIRHRAIDREPRPEVWMPYSQVEDSVLTTWLRGVSVAARTRGNPEAAIPALRAAMRQVDAALPLVNVRSMDELARRSTAARRLETRLLTTFAGVAVILAGVGLFGVLAFHVSRQRQEFGVRLALGATPADLFRNVMRRAVVLLAIGLAIGVPGALLMGRAMSALLYEVGPADPPALIAAATAMALVTLIACALPARRAMRTDPLTAIRTD